MKNRKERVCKTRSISPNSEYISLFFKEKKKSINYSMLSIHKSLYSH